jgi:hypothetical protein
VTDQGRRLILLMRHRYSYQHGIPACLSKDLLMHTHFTSDGSHPYGLALAGSAKRYPTPGPLLHRAGAGTKDVIKLLRRNGNP